MKIIDAHTHPFLRESQNIKKYGEKPSEFSAAKADLERIGISFFCGSVISRDGSGEENLITSNESALLMFEENSDIYLPGVVVHPEFKELSCSYLKKFHDKGLHLVGELTPYLYGWREYMGAAEIFEVASSLGMALNCHPTNLEDMEKLLMTFPQMEIVFAHPGTAPDMNARLELYEKYDNACIDISGGGTQRYGAVGEMIRRLGKERVLFGTDYPVCNPASFLHTVLYEPLTDDELEHVLYKNAERVYKIKNA